MSYKPDEKRYDSMIYNRCGKSGLKLPAISLGLWHNFGGVDAFPICLDTQDTDKIVEACLFISPTFGGINLGGSLGGSAVPGAFCGAFAGRESSDGAGHAEPAASCVINGGGYRPCCLHRASRRHIRCTGGGCCAPVYQSRGGSSAHGHLS